MPLLLNNNIGYTIVGNPTIIDGIVSNFSINNYLTLSAFTRNNFKQIFKIKTPNSFIAYAGLWQENVSTTYRSKIMFTNAGKLIINLSSTGSGWDIANNIVSDTALNSNTIYYIEFAYQNNKYYLRYSLNGLDFYNLIEPINSSYILRTEGSIIGFNTANNVAFNGEMDLNNFYIKENEITIFNGKQTASTSIQDIKFNNNVGYTIVGTPTINNNIASDFSENDYLITNASITASEISELVIKIKINSSALGKEEWQGVLVSNFFINYYCGTNGFEYAQIYFNGMNELSFTNSYLLSDTYYWLKYTNNGTNATSYISTDGKNYTQIQTKNSNTISVQVPNTITFGNRGSQVFDGIIDFNETYIKVGKTTWFNGKQTASTDVNYVMQNNGSVGYEIVGSPTINNGRISNTGNGNYISLPSTNLFSNSSFEYKSSFYIGENVLTGETGYIASMPFIGADGVLRAYGTYFGGGWLTIYCGVSADNTDIYYYTQLTPNTYYSIIWKRENGVLTTSLKVGNNPIQQILSDNGADLTNNPSGAGIAFGGLDMKDGYIDLNNTYIKVNNNYWFNGNSKLLWTNNNIYLQNLTGGGSGSDFGYIDAGFKPTNKTTFEFSFTKKNTSGSQINTSPFFVGGCTRDGITYNPFGVNFQNNVFTYFGYDFSMSYTAYNENKVYSTEISNGNYIYKENGVQISSTSVQLNQTTAENLYIGCWDYCYDSGNHIPYYPMLGNLNYIKFWEDGILIRHFVPVPANFVVGGGYKTPSICMFDIVEQKFYPNLGTNSFTYGKN